MAKQPDNIPIRNGANQTFTALPKPMLTLSGSWGRCVFCPADIVRMNADRMNKRIVLSFAGVTPVPDMVLNFLQADEFTATADTIATAINPNQG